MKGTLKFHGRIYVSKHYKTANDNFSMLPLSISPDHTFCSHSCKAKEDSKKRITKYADIKEYFSKKESLYLMKKIIIAPSYQTINKYVDIDCQGLHPTII